MVTTREVCPTCGGSSRWSPTRAVLRQGRLRVPANRWRKGVQRQTIRVYWPEPNWDWSYPRCPDAFHDPVQPVPRPNGTVALNPARAGAPGRRRAKARWHKDAQSKDYR